MKHQWVVALLAVLAFTPAVWADKSHEQEHQNSSRDSRQMAMPAPDKQEVEKRTGPRLEVQSVVLGEATEKGTEIRVFYHLVEVQQLPGHPVRSSVIINENEQGYVALRQLQTMPAGIPEDRLGETPVSVIVFHDANEVIRPGDSVTVVLAGMGHPQIKVEAGPGYREGGVQQAKADAEARVRASLPKDAKLMIHEVKTAGYGSLLHVTFSTVGVTKVDPHGRHTYVLDPETGKRFDILRVPRLGMMAPKDLQDLRISFMIIQNPAGHFKPGDKVTVVVSGLRQENVEVVAGGARTPVQPPAPTPAAQAAE